MPSPHPIARPFSFSISISIALSISLAGCDAAPTGAARDGGGDGSMAPVRSCATQFRYTPDHSVGKVELGGEWNKFDPTQTPMSGPDRAGAYTASVTLLPGSYGYKVVLDGTDWRLDPANPYSKYVGGLENSVVEVGDCKDPQLTFVGLDKSAAGAMRARVQYVDGNGAAGLDGKRVEAVPDGAPTTPASIAAVGLITVEATGLPKDKHRLIVRAADRAGRSAAEL